MSFSVFSFLSSFIVLALFAEQCYSFKLPTFGNDTGEVHHLGVIVGGKIGDYRNFPYMAKLHHTSGGYCGAAILNANWVVSAAHCIKNANDPSSQYVRVGINSRFDSNIQRNQYQAAEIINHPGWRNNDGVDLTLIRLRTPIQFRDGIKAGCVDYTERQYGYLTIMGYGGQSYRIVDRNGNVIEYEKPGNEFKYDYAREDRGSRYCGTMDMVCVEPYYSNSGTGCFGDSGSPIVNPSNEILGVYAILYGDNIGNGQYRQCVGHSGYTRLSRYSSFIDRHVGAGNYCARR